MTTEQINTQLLTHIGPELVPGAVMLVANGTEVLYQQALGSADIRTGQALETDAMFQLMSMTKPVTSVAIMMLIEQGRLSLDQNAAELLPWLADVPVVDHFDAATSAYTLKPLQGTMTIRQLLNHTAGFGYSFSSHAIRAFEADKSNANKRSPLLHEPGERWTYSLATGVLGMIVESVSGQTLDVFFQQFIFSPLGMQDTTYFPDEHQRARLVAIHSRAAGELTARDSFPDDKPAGDYGLKSTAQDYCTFLQMLLNEGADNGHQLLSPGSVELMSSNQIGSLMVELQDQVDTNLSLPFPHGAGTDKFGFGFQIHAGGDPDKRRPGSYSWSGLCNTHFWIDPEEQIVGVTLMQLLPFYDPSCMALMDAFEQLVYAELV